jgi:saccharopine dehydrogenase-like NADP-dependent oxidoreductase
MTGKTCAGVWVTGLGKDERPKEVYVYHVADNQWTMEHFETQCVVWQTALGPAVALECVANGSWSGVGVLGPEAFDARTFLDLMGSETSAGGYGQPFGVDDRSVSR